MQEQFGHTIGPYRIESVLGRGGMGVVYAVRHPGSPALLALKTLEATAPLETRLRFKREIELLRQVDHPHVLKLLDTGQAEDGRVYLVTELVPGQDLREQCKGAPLTPQRALHVMRALSEAVRALHAQGILHRDLKPENVILRPNGSPVLLDFGIARADEVARLTKTGEILGTPAFMSPEQVDGQGVDERADVYGLAAILFYLLSGHAPFTGKTAFALYRQVLFEEPEWPTADATVAEPQYDSEVTAWSFADDDAPLDARELRANLWQVCRRGMAKELDQRHSSAAAFGAALEQLAHGGRAQRAPRPKRPWGLVAVLLAIVAAVGLGVGYAATRPPPATDAPEASAAEVPPAWESETIERLPSLGSPHYRSALERAKPQTVGEQTALTRLKDASLDLGEWQLKSDADLAAWSKAYDDLPPQALGPLNLLRSPQRVFHHAEHRPPPEDTRNLDDHLEDNAVVVAFCDAAGSRYVTVGHRTLKLWSWPATLTRTVELPKNWTLTLCLAVQADAERVFLGGRVLIPRARKPGDYSERAALATYTFDEPQVTIPQGLSEATELLGRDRMHVLGLFEDTLVGGTNEGVLCVFSAKGKISFQARGKVFGDANVRGVAFLDDPTHFFTVNGDNNDEAFALQSQRLSPANCQAERRQLEFRGPPKDKRVFYCLAGTPTFGLYAGHAEEGVVAEYTIEKGRGEPLVDPRAGRAHYRSAIALAPAHERGWLASVSGWAEWEAEAADHAVRSGRLSGAPATLCIWDLKTSTLLGRYAQLHEFDGFSSVAITPDGSRVLAGTSFGDVLCWDLE